MMTVTEVSRLSGVSVRTLHHYDHIGLLKPAEVTQAGYRLYGQNELETLHTILFYRELRFPLKDVRRIMQSPDFDRNRALEEQIKLLEKQLDHTETLLTYARGILLTGVKHMDFSAFDTRKMDEYAQQAKTLWGNTDAYREFEKRSQTTTEADRAKQEEGVVELMRRFGEKKRLPPESEEAQALVEELRTFITAHFYNCTLPILRGLGRMYNGGGSITENIEEAGGKGTADFAANAIEIYCSRHS